MRSRGLLLLLALAGCLWRLVLAENLVVSGKPCPIPRWAARAARLCSNVGW